MDVRIGVIYSAREIEVDLGESADADTVQNDVDAAVAQGGHVLWLIDRKGRKVGIPADKIAYVEIGSSSGERRIGFVG